MEETLFATLRALSKSTREKVAEYQSSGELTKTRTPYMRYEVVGFEYSDGAVSYNVGSFVNIEKEEWHWKDQHEFFQRAIRTTPEYSDSVAEISERCQVPEAQADDWLSRFVRSLLSSAIVSDIDDEFVDNQIAIFIGDLNKAPVDWRIELWLGGIGLEDERYEIEEGMVLRRPRASDLETEIPFFALPLDSARSLHASPSAILESISRSSDTREVQRGVGTILDILRLFKLGSVVDLQTTILPHSILELGFTSTPASKPAATYRYSFADTDVAPLRDFRRIMKPLLSADIMGETKPLGIALQRYKDALLKPGPVESRITSAITCLEALYLRAEERMELSHRLGQRTALLLRLLGFQPLEVYDKVKQAYSIRSTFIHGSRIKRSQQTPAEGLCDATLEYARVSLIAFLQLKNNVDKKGLISKLDNSLLDENALQELRGLISENEHLLIPLTN